MDNFAMVSGNIQAIPAAVRKKICFMRVWCLVEAQQAYKMGIPYIMKCGSYSLDVKGGIHFNANGDMLHKMKFLVNVEKAEATVASDRERIIETIEKDVGIEALNSIIRGSIIACSQFAGNEKSALISCAACGDQGAIALMIEDPSNIFDIAMGGFIDLLRRQVGEGGADVNTANKDGSTAVMRASQGGHLQCIKYLVCLLYTSPSPRD